MERTTNLKPFKNLFGRYFIGPEEITSINHILKLNIPKNIPIIPYKLNQLIPYSNDYILILCLNEFLNNSPMNILNLRNIFGYDPDISEPCFYNQDWYLNQTFVNNSFDLSWILIKKQPFDETRSMIPDKIINNQSFPSAIQCVYTFFIVWLLLDECLWKHDYIWCKDFDNNGDRIYVGRYYDFKRENKNGFSIHRHLTIRDCYTAINVL